MTHSTKDSKLIEQAVRDLQAGKDREANARLIFEKYAPEIRKYLRGFLSERQFDREDIRDLIQIVFLSVYEHIGKFRGESPFINWVIRIAKHKAVDEARRRKNISSKVTLVSLDDDHDGQAEAWNIADTSSDTNPHDAVRDAELRRAVEKAINELPPRMQECLNMRVFLNLSIEQIARAMRIEVNTVKSLLGQARKRLREELKDSFDG